MALCSSWCCKPAIWLLISQWFTLETWLPALHGFWSTRPTARNYSYKRLQKDHCITFIIWYKKKKYWKEWNTFKHSLKFLKYRNQPDRWTIKQESRYLLYQNRKLIGDKNKDGLGLLVCYFWAMIYSEWVYDKEIQLYLLSCNSYKCMLHTKKRQLHWDHLALLLFSIIIIRPATRYTGSW